MNVYCCTEHLLCAGFLMYSVLLQFPWVKLPSGNTDGEACLPLGGGGGESCWRSMGGMWQSEGRKDEVGTQTIPTSELFLRFLSLASQSTV